MEDSQKEIQSMQRDLKDLKENVHAILALLRGNEIDKDDKGHLGIVNDHENRISKLEKLKDKAIYILIGMSIPAGFGIANIIGWIVEHFK